MSGFLLTELTEVSLAGLREITDNEGLSFPIAGLSYLFLRDKRQAGSRLTFEEEPPVGIDHSVVVLDVSEEKVVVFDPLERFSRGGKGGDGVITVSGPSFLAYWSQASVDRQWLMYAAPIVKKGVRTLDEYKGKEDENQN